MNESRETDAPQSHTSGDAEKGEAGQRNDEDNPNLVGTTFAATLLHLLLNYELTSTLH